MLKTVLLQSPRLMLDHGEPISEKNTCDSRRRLVARRYSRDIQGLKVMGKANCRFIIREEQMR